MGAEAVFTFVLGMGLVSLVIVATSHVRRKYRAFTVFSLASYCYAFVYGIVPMYYLLYPEAESATDIIAKTYHTSIQYSVLLIAIAGYLVLICGYVFGNRYKPKTQKPKHKYVPLYIYGSWAFFTFMFGMFGVWVDIYLQGGISNSIHSIELARSFDYSPAKDGMHNPLAFFRMFKYLVYFSFYLYYMLAKQTKSSRYKFMFFFTFVVTAYCIFINGGRTHIFILLATIVLGYFANKASNKKAIFVTFIIGVASLVMLDPLFYYLTWNVPYKFQWSLSFQYIVFQFSFPYTNMIFVTSHEFSHRFFQDAYLWLISILPSFVLNNMGVHEHPPLYEYNTILQRDTMLLGGLPDDILTLGYYQLGFAGIVLTVFVFGFLLTRIDSLIMHFKNNMALRPIISRIVIYMAMMVMYADLEGTFRGRIDVIMLLFLLGHYRKYKSLDLQPTDQKHESVRTVSSVLEPSQRYVRI